jgi:asparagine synthase (glutamine-hydrolysing)
MCGICGLVQVGGEPRPTVEPWVLDRMTDAMVHRGPNDRGVYQRDGVALGVRRLSIVDVEGGHQPFANEDGGVRAIQNGELYNHVEVRRELGGRGHRFHSRCDTEVIPHLYEQHGDAFPEHLRGKFAIALWDERRRRAVLARDRLGVKPLYWARRDDLVVFASELKSLLASGLIEPELDYEAIDAYLTFGFVPAPLTPLRHVCKLLPGHRLVIDASGVRSERYWAYPKPQPDSPPLPEQEYAEGLLAELEDAVRARLMSDVPLGAMLSGGLDSSLIVALMARNMSEPVKTFSVGFREDGASNELADARYVARAFDTDHHELELSYHDAAIDIADLVWHLDEPMADLSALGLLALSDLAARHVTVALSGQGADELLGGYRKHQAATLVAAYDRIPLARRLSAQLARRAPGRFARAGRTLAADNPVDRLLAMSGVVSNGLRERLLLPHLNDGFGDAGRRAVTCIADGVSDDPLSATLFIDGQLALVDDLLHYFDRASMAHSLEVRVPFLDHNVVEYCAQIPRGLKVRRLTTKYVLKRAALGFVPYRTIHKRKIGFFRGAADGWLRAQLAGALSDYLLAPNARYSEFLDTHEVRGLVGAHLHRGSRQTQLVLALLMLEVWLSTYVPRAVSSTTRPRVEATV